MANTLRRLAGGLLTGIGRGLELGATQRMQEERELRLEERRLALANLQHGWRVEEREDEQSARLDELKTTGVINQDNAAREIAGRTAGSVTLARVQGDIQNADREDRQEHETSLERLRSQNDINEAEAAWARSEETRLAVQGQEVNDWRVSRDGYLGGYNARGELIAQSRQPVHVPPGSSRSDDDDGPSLSSRRPTPRQAPQARPPARPQERRRNPELDRLDQSLARLDPEYARLQGRERQQRLQREAGRLGVSLWAE